MQGDFPARIRVLRKQRGLTQLALARAIGVSKASICHWEAGRAAPRRKHLASLAKALGVTPAVLANGGKPIFEPILLPEPESLGSIIHEAKLRIAAFSGIEPSRVKVMLNY